MIRELVWSDDIRERLAHQASRDCLPILLQEVRSGVAQLWECVDGDDTLTVITRLDRNPTEWVICYVQGSGVAKFAPWFFAVARSRDWPLRVHTTDTRLMRLFRRLGFRHEEFVMRYRHGLPQ